MICPQSELLDQLSIREKEMCREMNYTGVLRKIYSSPRLVVPILIIEKTGQSVQSQLSIDNDITTQDPFSEVITRLINLRYFSHPYTSFLNWNGFLPRSEARTDDPPLEIRGPYRTDYLHRNRHPKPVVCQIVVLNITHKTRCDIVESGDLVAL